MDTPQVGRVSPKVLNKVPTDKDNADVDKAPVAAYKPTKVKDKAPVKKPAAVVEKPAAIVVKDPTIVVNEKALVLVVKETLVVSDKMHDDVFKDVVNDKASAALKIYAADVKEKSA
ncbi:hypothetical protein Tco_0918963, partial [Tanacetum coccineum]